MVLSRALLCPEWQNATKIKILQKTEDKLESRACVCGGKLWPIIYDYYTKEHSVIATHSIYTFCLGMGAATLDDLTCCSAISTALLPPIKFGWEVFM